MLFDSAIITFGVPHQSLGESLAPLPRFIDHTAPHSRDLDADLKKGTPCCIQLSLYSW